MLSSDGGLQLASVSGRAMVPGRRAPLVGSSAGAPWASRQRACRLYQAIEKCGDPGSRGSSGSPSDSSCRRPGRAQRTATARSASHRRPDKRTEHERRQHANRHRRVETMATGRRRVPAQRPAQRREVAGLGRGPHVRGIRLARPGGRQRRRSRCRRAFQASS